MDCYRHVCINQYVPVISGTTSNNGQFIIVGPSLPRVAGQRGRRVFHGYYAGCRIPTEWHRWWTSAESLQTVDTDGSSRSPRFRRFAKYRQSESERRSREWRGWQPGDRHQRPGISRTQRQFRLHPHVRYANHELYVFTEKIEINIFSLVSSLVTWQRMQQMIAISCSRWYDHPDSREQQYRLATGSSHMMDLTHGTVFHHSSDASLSNVMDMKPQLMTHF